MIINSVKLPTLRYTLGLNKVFPENPVLNISTGNDIVSFTSTAGFGEDIIPVNLEPLREHSGVHCPSCGTLILSEQDYEYIINNVSQATNAKELINIFYNNKKFIVPKFQSIFEDIGKIEDSESMTIPEFRQEMSKFAYLRKKMITHKTRDYLIEYASNFPTEKSQKAIDIVNEIRTKQIYSVQKDKIIEYIKELELNETEANRIFQMTLKPLFLANGYFMLFNSSKLSQILPEDYGVFIAERLFGPSIGQITNISNYPNHINMPDNKVLVCNSCEHNKSKNYFWKTENYRELKDNMKAYLTDISYLKGKEEVNISPNYLKIFIYLTTKLSKQNIDFTQSEIKAIKNVARSAKRHEKFAPIEQTEVDIPCAECGSVMLPHTKRKEIEKELKQCITPYEYSQVLEKNMKYVGKNYRVLANIFLDIVKDNPQITNEKFIKEFKKKEAHYTDRAVQNAISGFLKNRSYVVEKYPQPCLEIYDTFATRLLEYVSHGKFKDYDVSALYNTCLKDLDMKNYPVKPVNILMRNLKTISYKHLCATLDNKYDFNDKDSIYTILFHLFKYNVATADHLTPEVKGGEGDKYNLIGLCKSCNRTKSKKNVYNWYLENKHLEPNLKKQLIIVDKMAKSGQIEGYDNWAKTIAQKVYEQTYGKLDLREDFV